MKVFDLVCAGGHRFEGWFASADDFSAQVVRCPLCDGTDVERAPSAPRLNLGGNGGGGECAAKSEPVALAAGAMLKRLRRIVADAEDVGPRFADEARRIHYDEAKARSIRGTATANERRALDEEGIDTVAIALPPAITETLQ